MQYPAHIGSDSLDSLLFAAKKYGNLISDEGGTFSYQKHLFGVESFHYSQQINDIGEILQSLPKEGALQYYNAEKERHFLIRKNCIYGVFKNAIFDSDEWGTRDLYTLAFILREDLTFRGIINEKELFPFQIVKMKIAIEEAMPYQYSDPKENPVYEEADLGFLYTRATQRVATLCKSFLFAKEKITTLLVNFPSTKKPWQLTWNSLKREDSKKR